MNERTQFLFFSKLAALLKTGIALDKAIELMGRHSETETMGNALDKIAGRLKEGSSFEDALGGSKNVFAPDAIEAAASASKSGNFPEALKSISDSLLTRYRWRLAHRSSHIYSAVIIAAAFALIGVFEIYVIPNFVQMFDGQGGNLPGLTRLAINISYGFSTYWYVTLIIISIFAVLFFSLRQLFDTLALYVPVVGRNIALAESLKFTHSVAVSLSSGMELAQAFKNGIGVVENSELKSQLDSVSAGLRDGQSVGALLQKAADFPRNLAQLIDLGEGRNELAKAFIEASRLAADELESRRSFATTLPAVFVITVILFFIIFNVLAIYLPIFSMATI